MKFTSNTWIIIASIVVILGGGYWYFFTGSSGNDMPLTAGDAASPTQVRFQTLVSELAPITFDTAIFSDARFNSLVDLSTPVAPEPSGKLDPFAPIAGIVSSQ